MNFEFLVEDVSGKRMLEVLVPKIIDADIHSFRIHHYKGIGSIPKGLKTAQDASKRVLLNKLPGLLAGYGRTYRNRQNENVVIVVCDLDDRNKNDFLDELNDVLNACNPAPHTNFCLAIEEGEAWLLGDINAIKRAYPKARDNFLNSYRNDSICGTWELLANAIYSGGSKKLNKLGFAEIGKQKSEWAINICPYMDVNNNKSPSFNEFKRTLERECV